jgi:hypothetical protein
MTFPFALPDWVPWWVNIAILVPMVLFALAFVLMPFSVFGIKGRLESVEARLDEIQGEIRSLALRLPEPSLREPAFHDSGFRDPGFRDPGFREPAYRESDYRDQDLREPAPRDVEPDRAERGGRGWSESRPRPPIPPAPRTGDVDRPPPPTRRVDPTRGARAEPRFDPR